MNYPFVESDAGRSLSRRPKQSNDCTVRALSLVTSVPYDTVYDLLAAEGRKCGRGFQFKNFVRRSGVISQSVPGEILGHSVDKFYFPGKRGERRMNPFTFARTKPFNEGRWIVKVAKHVFAFIDGTAYDMCPEPDDRCIYTAFRFVKK